MSAPLSVKPLFFIKTPPLEQLSGLILECTQNTYRNNKIVQKCRQLIFTEPEVLASPCLHIATQINVVLKTDLRNSDEFRRHLQKVELLVTSEFPVTPRVFQECLNYTIIAKLAPSWNKMGTLFVQGKDFLITEEPMNAICMELIMTNDYAEVSVEALGVRSRTVKLEDFFDGPEKCSEAATKLASPVELTLSQPVRGYILPDMKEGTILSMTRCLQKGNPFHGTYKGLKQYWKNMYGYRLPGDGENVTYFNVIFGRFARKSFLYPEFCVRTNELMFIRRVSPKPIISSFLMDLEACIRTVCGERFQLISPKAVFPVPTLHLGTENHEKVGLASSIPASNVPLRELPQPHVSTPIQKMVSNYHNEIMKKVAKIDYPSNQVDDKVQNITPVFERKRKQVKDESDKSLALSNVKRLAKINAEESSQSNLVAPQVVNMVQQVNMEEISRNHNLVAQVMNATQGINTGQSGPHNLAMLHMNMAQQINVEQPSQGNLVAPQIANVIPSSERLSEINNLLRVITNQPEISRTILVQQPTINQGSFQPALLPKEATSNDTKKAMAEENTCIQRTQNAECKRKFDIVQLAEKNELHKANIPSLISWLKQQGERCSSKTRKQELIDAVMKRLQRISGNQQV